VTVVVVVVVVVDPERRGKLLIELYILTY